MTAVDLERTSDRHRMAAEGLPIDIALTCDHRLASLSVAGELDGSTADELLGAVAHLLSGPAPDVVEPNLTDLEFVDTAAWAANSRPTFSDSSSNASGSSEYRLRAPRLSCRPKP